jgi:heptosyltransferase-2
MTEFHQTRVWEGLLRNFGLKEETDLSALPRLEGPKGKSIEKIRIGLAPGSNNTPSKRWPVESWIVICENLISESQGKEITLELFGTNQDKSLCASIKHSLPSSLCIDHAGKTSLVELMNHFRQLDVLICNDSGAMHLANAAGTPVVAIFGPTDPSITGPIYESTFIIIQSETANAMEGIDPMTVVKEALQVIGLQV